MNDARTEGALRTLTCRLILVAARVGCSIAVLALVGCPSRTEGPPICSTEGIARISDAGVGDTVLGRLCPDWKPIATQENKRTEVEPVPWKTPPTTLSRIKTDTVSFLDKPALVYVAVKPTDYFNYGYANARETHFGFELAQLGPDGDVQPLRIYGYADRKWARPFFEKVSRDLESAKGKYDWVQATLVVTYKRSRYQSSSEHLEILAASMGEDRSLTPESRSLGDGDADAGVAGSADRPDAGTRAPLSLVCVPYKDLVNGEDSLSDQPPEVREAEARKLPKVRFAVEGSIQVVHVRSVVLVVMDLHRLFVDMRLERIVCVRQRRQRICHG